MANVRPASHAVPSIQSLELRRRLRSIMLPTSSAAANGRLEPVARCEDNEVLNGARRLQGLHVDEEAASVAGEAGGTSYRVGVGGLDVVEFLLAPGPQEPLRPLAATASGGESARIMMALKAAPAAATAASATGMGRHAGARRSEAICLN